MDNQQDQNRAPEEKVQEKTTMDVDGPPPLESTQEQYNQENKKQKLPETNGKMQILHNKSLVIIILPS
jgi:hypothetical protein